MFVNLPLQESWKCFRTQRMMVLKSRLNAAAWAGSGTLKSVREMELPFKLNNILFEVNCMNYNMFSNLQGLELFL